MAHDTEYDVAVIGGGIAAVSAAVFLRRAGLGVVCVENEPYPHHRVGESLDWSSPWLFEQVGLSPEGLLADGVATPKNHIVVTEVGKAPWQAKPWSFLKSAPVCFATSTLHVDRTALDQRIYEHAVALGAEFIWERASTVEVDGDRVRAVTTTGGRRITARWFVDATGTAGLFAKALAVPRTYYGEPKVALWTYFDTPLSTPGTTFFVDNSDRYLHWVWDIPITPTRTSIGFILPAESMKARRHAGANVGEILRTELGRFERFDALLRDQPDVKVASTSYQPYVTTRACGANWLMIGEAASMPDPLTGNGVTSAMRHARYAAMVIAKAGDAAEIPAPRRQWYTTHVRRLGHAFNRSIERAVYQPGIRLGLGLMPSTLIYTIFGFFMNALYTRFDPQGPFGMAAFGVLFAGVRLWIDGWSLLARTVLRLRGPVTRRIAAAVVAR